MAQGETVPNLSNIANFSNCSTQFQKDFNQLYEDIEGSGGFKAAEKLEAKEKAYALKERSMIFEKYKNNPGLLLMMLTTGYFGQGMDNLYSSQLNQDASGLKVQTDLTKLTNDLQNIINSGSSNPDAVTQVAAGADLMESILGPSGQYSPSWAGDLQNAIGGTQTAGFMDQNFASIRGEINWSADPDSGFNPPSSSTTVYFDVGGTSGMQTFAQMQTDLSKQGSTDAQDANKGFIDAYNQNVAVTQSMGTAANTEIGLITSKVKLNTTTVSDLAQDFLTLDRTAINNEVSRS